MGKTGENRVARLRTWLGGLSFRTGVVLIAVCIVCYIVSFAQMLLPVSVTTKGVLWFIFFGMAKTAQYAGIAVLGTAGIKRLRQWHHRRNDNKG